jgi:ribosomal protein S18 acetylase RimI-like enzyme
MDMLVSLYSLTGAPGRLLEVQKQGVTVRRPLAHERSTVIDWVGSVFGANAPGWASECAVAFSSVPPNCLIATREGEILGFACFEVTAKGFFGPTGTAPHCRGLGIGGALLVTSLAAMHEAGYAYAVIGGVGDDARDFYEKVIGAVPIADSTPGIYRDAIS